MYLIDHYFRYRTPHRFWPGSNVKVRKTWLLPETLVLSSSLPCPRCKIKRESKDTNRTTDVPFLPPLFSTFLGPRDLLKYHVSECDGGWVWFCPHPPCYLVIRQFHDFNISTIKLVNLKEYDYVIGMGPNNFINQVYQRNGFWHLSRIRYNLGSVPYK